MYKLGEVYQVNLGLEFKTFVEIVAHLHGIGFKSLVAPANDPAIGMNVFAKYDTLRICDAGDEAKRKEILAEMKASLPTHSRLWQYFAPHEWLTHETTITEIRTPLN